MYDVQITTYKPMCQKMIRNLHTVEIFTLLRIWTLFPIYGTIDFVFIVLSDSRGQSLSGCNCDVKVWNGIGKVYHWPVLGRVRETERL